MNKLNIFRNDRRYLNCVDNAIETHIPRICKPVNYFDMNKHNWCKCLKNGDHINIVLEAISCGMFILLCLMFEKNMRVNVSQTLNLSQCTNEQNKKYIHIFTFNKHFDKENDCVFGPVITKPHHWRKLFITFYVVSFVLFKNKNLTYLMK